MNKTNPRGDIKSTIAEAEKALARNMSQLNDDVSFVSGSSSLSMLSNMAVQHGDEEEAYDPEREWAS